MRRGVSLIVALCVMVGVAGAAFAKNDAESGAGGGSGYGGSYVQRPSGLYVPRDYAESNSPSIAPVAKDFGADLAKDYAKDAVKAGIGGFFAGVASSIKNASRATVEWVAESSGPILPWR